MPSHQIHSFERIIVRTAVLVAAIVALSVPASFAYGQYRKLTESLTFKAKVKAATVNELIAQIPETWMYADNRLQGLLSHVPVPVEDECIQVRDPHGVLLVQTGDFPAAPFTSVSVPLSDSGVTVGSLIIFASLNTYFMGVAISTLLSLILAGLIYLALKILPLQALRRASEVLFLEKERAETTLHAIDDAVITTDTECRINYINPAAQRLLGHSLHEVRNKPIDDVVRLIVSDTREKTECSLHSALGNNRRISSIKEMNLLRSDGSLVDVEESASPIHNHDGNVSGGVIVLRDVSIARNFLKQQTWEATHDTLTGLYNRREFEHRIHDALLETQKTGRTHVLCYMDLDRFKLVNDTSGHAAGDQLLIEIGKLMLARIRNTDTLARIGSDEYGLLLENCDSDVGHKIASEIKAAINGFQFNWEAKQHTVGVSIGLTVITPDHTHVADLIAEADNACFWSKEHQLDQVTVSATSNASLAARRSEISWVAKINSAFNENRFVLYHQRCKTLNRSAHYREHIEILIRMVDETGQIIAPGLFLPAAERYAMMPEIDRWVIQQVFSRYEALIAKRAGKPVTYCIILHQSLRRIAQCSGISQFHSGTIPKIPP